MKTKFEPFRQGALHILPSATDSITSHKQYPSISTYICNTDVAILIYSHSLQQNSAEKVKVFLIQFGLRNANEIVDGWLCGLKKSYSILRMTQF